MSLLPELELPPPLIRSLPLKDQISMPNPIKKQAPSKVDLNDLVFTDPDKKRRAEDVLLILAGKNPREAQMSIDHKTYLRERFGELMAEAGVGLDDRDAALLFIYKKMGGATRTHQQMAQIKKQGNIFKSKAAKEAAPDDSDAGDDGEDDGDDDEE